MSVDPGVLSAGITAAGTIAVAAIGRLPGKGRDTAMREEMEIARLLADMDDGSQEMRELRAEVVRDMLDDARARRLGSVGGVPVPVSHLLRVLARGLHRRGRHVRGRKAAAGSPSLRGLHPARRGGAPTLGAPLRPQEALTSLPSMTALRLVV